MGERWKVRPSGGWHERLGAASGLLFPVARLGLGAGTVHAAVQHVPRLPDWAKRYVRRRDCDTRDGGDGQVEEGLSACLNRRRF